ncbi:MAG: hypothetical protein DRG78_02375 [Epsilonproteobacteria bacterium]|nr:MAG: hypothetical protein DRG78_02375 [Campylobacterota bacterium]
MKIAIIDDNRSLANTIRDIIELEFDEAEIDIFSSKVELEQFLEENDIEWEVVFMDYNLEEDVTGIDVAKIMKKYTNKDFKLIFITGEGSFFLSTKLKVSGLNYDYIEKNSQMENKILDILDEFIE